MTYAPRPDSYAAKAISVLRANPEAWFSSPDLCARIDCGGSSIRAVLEFAIINGAIAISRRGALNYYRLGDGAPRVDGLSDTMPPSSVFDLGTPRGRPTARFAPGADGSVTVERAGRRTERFSADEARALALFLDVGTGS